MFVIPSALFLAYTLSQYVGDPKQNDPYSMVDSDDQIPPVSNQEHVQNYILDADQPNSYANIPRLKTFVREDQTDLRPAMSHPEIESFNYNQLSAARPGLERQFMTLSNETPLELGALPNPSRSSGTMLRNPMSGHELKPPKREVEMQEIYTPEPNRRDVPGYNRAVDITSDLKTKIAQEAKLYHGTGALDSWTLGGDSGPGNATRGFATGEIMTRRNGGQHPRERFYRFEENKRGRNQHEFRFLAPRVTTQRGSVYGDSLGPLGELRLRQNSDVDTWYRPPEATDGLAPKPPITEFVELKIQDRDRGDDTYPYGNTEIEWAGQAFKTTGPMEALRENNRMQYTRPKNLSEYDNSDYMVPYAHYNQRGAYAIHDAFAMIDLDEQMTNRTLDESFHKPFQTETEDWELLTQPTELFEDLVENNNTMNSSSVDYFWTPNTRVPAPHFGQRGSGPSQFDYIDILRPSVDKDAGVFGRAAPPHRPDNFVADGSSFIRFNDVESTLRYTPKGESRFINFRDMYVPVEDKSYISQIPEFPCPEVRQVSPWITRDINMNIMTPYLQNEFTQPLPNPYATPIRPYY